MRIALRQLACAVLAVGMFLAPRIGSAQEGARSVERTPELAQFEKDVAQLRGAHGAPARSANPGIRLNVENPATLLDGRVVEGGITAQATSFVVWLQNQTPSILTTQVYWRDVYSTTIHQTGAAVYPWQVAPHITSPCGSVIAYIMDVYENGYYIASTGATQPIATDGAPCSDAWTITQ